MQIDLANLPMETSELVNRHQEEIIAARNKRLFGRESEKLTNDELQYWLFNEVEGVIREKASARSSTLPVKAHSRVKRGRKPLSDKLPREVIIHDIPEEEKICPWSLKPRPKIGEDVREELGTTDRLSKRTRIKNGYADIDGRRSMMHLSA